MENNIETSIILDNTFNNLLNAINAGRNKLSQNIIVETLVLDDSWVDILENNIYSLEQIIATPKKFIKDEKQLVAIERAKKIDNESIRYLASHSNHVRSMDKLGNVEPSKVLTKEMVEDYGIYENRFVYTLILRLITFVEQRYNAIQKRIDTHDITKLTYNSSFHYAKSEVECDLNIKIKSPSRNKVILEKNHQLLYRLQVISKKLATLKASEFGKILSRAKLINPPINKTNLINMNVDYRNAYKLWVFVASYNNVGFSVELSDKNLSFDDDYFTDLTKVVAESINTMITNNVLRKSLYQNIPYRERKPKKYKVINAVDYTPSFKREVTTPNDELINQFYFDEIKALLQKCTRTPAKNTFVDSQEMVMSFSKFYKGLAKINNSMISELVLTPTKKQIIKKRTKLERAKDEFKAQNELYKQYKLVSKLKANELASTLKRESTQMVKLEKLKYQLNLITAKAAKKRKPKKAPSKVKAVNEKLTKVLDKSDINNLELLTAEYNRQKELEAQKLARKAELKRLRLEKKLALLQNSEAEND